MTFPVKRLTHEQRVDNAFKAPKGTLWITSYPPHIAVEPAVQHKKFGYIVILKARVVAGGGVKVWYGSPKI